MVREAGPTLATSWLWLGKHPLLVPISCLAVIDFFAYSSFYLFHFLAYSSFVFLLSHVGLHVLLLQFLASGEPLALSFWTFLVWDKDYPFDWLFCQVEVSCFLKSTLLFGYIAKLQSPHSHVAKSTSKLSFKLLTNQQMFWAVQGKNLLSWSVKLLPPKNQMTPDLFIFSFPWAAYTPAPNPPFSFSLVSSYFCRLDDSLKLNRSPFKFQTTIYIVFWTYWEQICVNLEIAELDSIVLILPGNNPCFFFLLNMQRDMGLIMEGHDAHERR